MKKLHNSAKNSTTYIDFTYGTKRYIQLRETVIKKGILERDYVFYFKNTVITLFGLFFSAFMIYKTPISFALILWSLIFSFFTVQVGGLIHDAGHRAIANSIKINDFLGNLFGAIVVIGYSAWNEKHNKHHSHTNEEDEDPDLELPLHAFTKSYYQKQKGIWKYLRNYQVFTFYPLRSLVAFSIRFRNFSYIKDKSLKQTWWLIIIWIIGLIIWFVLPFLVFSLPKALLVFVIVHFCSGFYLSNIFAPNHKGMPLLQKNTKISFLERQIMTSRNIFGGTLTDYIYMGLNYQIEHHLFPNCPRNKLNLITPYVLEICRELNLEYTQVSIIESNRIILSTLNIVVLSSH